MSDNITQTIKPAMTPAKAAELPICPQVELREARETYCRWDSMVVRSTYADRWAHYRSEAYEAWLKACVAFREAQ